jgi:hypothetical protein
MNNTKIAFVVTMHQSEKISPYGLMLIDRCLNSIRESVVVGKYKVFLFDNSSTEKIDLSKYSDMNISYTYVEDQRLRGLTGTWNDGVIAAFNEGYDKVFMVSDDVIFNGSINYLLMHSSDDNVTYGPLCQPGGMYQNQTGTHPQIAEEPVQEIRDITGGAGGTSGLGGWLFGFTKKFYEKYKRDDGYMFNPGEKYLWGGQELEFQSRVWKEGVKSYIIGLAWIYHEKQRSWKYHEGYRFATREDRDAYMREKYEDFMKWKVKMETPHHVGGKKIENN